MSRTPNHPDHAGAALDRHRDRRSLLRWLEDFARAVRDADYDRGRALFVPDALGFGTVGPVLEGIDELVEAQWKRVWGVTEGFAFNTDRAACGSEGDLGWAAASWSSWGTRSRDATRFLRRGRATFVLRRDGDRWLAIHSHVSLDPKGVGPDQT